MINNKKISPIVNGLFIRGRKIFPLFLSHSVIMKISNKQELRQMAFDHLSYTGF